MIQNNPDASPLNVFLAATKSILIAFMFLAGWNAVSQTTRYVKAGSTNGDGLSWATASNNLQATINGSAAGDQVWVATGTYQPAAGTSYSMKDGVKIYGGFAAIGTPVFSSRNSTNNPTIFQGNGNRVFNNTNIGNTSVLDGCIIQGGLLTGGDSGAGILNNNSAPVISNCIIRNNTADNWGGGVHNNGSGSQAKFVNCLFYGNSAGGGGGAFDFASAATTYINCTFSANQSSQNGGGIHTHNDAVATLYNCIVFNNHANAGGNDVFSSGNGFVTASYSIVTNDNNNIVGTFNGTAILNSNPLFSNAAASDYTLNICSPAINAGSSSFIPSGITTDLASNTRFYSNGVADIGAFEKQAALTAPVAAPQSFCYTATVAALSASGTNLKWYTAVTGGTAMVTTTAIYTGTYYVSQTIEGCESTRTAVNVTVTSPAAPVASAQSFCISTFVSALVAAGISLKWYAAETGGTAFAGNKILTTGTYNYWVSQTINGCESTRTAVSITIYPTTASPTADSQQTFCASAVTSDIVATGPNVRVYDAPSGGSNVVFPDNEPLISGHVYWVSRTVNGCESYRVSVQINLLQTPGPPGVASAPQTFCGSATVASLNASGQALKWYNSNTSTTPLATNAAISTGTYYVSQTFNTCEGPRSPANVVVYPLPSAPTASAQTYCSSVTVGNLVATGTNIKWYDSNTATTALSPNAYLYNSTTLYASQTVNGCEGPRVAVSININLIPVAPLVENQTLQIPSINYIVASGQNFKLYTANYGGTALANNTVLTDGYYYLSQTVNGCESPRKGFYLTISNIAYTANTIFVKKNGTSYGQSFAEPMGELSRALAVAAYLNSVTPGAITRIFVAKGMYHPLYRADNGSISNASDPFNAFVLLPNVAIYGGFAGNETALAQRNLSITSNASVLNGDFGENDTYDAAGLSSGNLGDNARHVVVSCNVNGATLDGFTISGGVAGQNDSYSVNGIPIYHFYGGGGIITQYSSPTLTNLEVKSNYGNGLYLQGYNGVLSNSIIHHNKTTYYGGGISINSFRGKITNCSICNNMAANGGGIMDDHGDDYTPGTVSNCLIYNNSASSGGGICFNQAYSNYVNVTITGNKGTTFGGGGGVFFDYTSYSNGNIKMRNSIVWGNIPAANNFFYYPSYSATKATISNSIISGSGGSSAWATGLGTNGGGNLDADPQFRDAANLNFRLLSSSPAFNAGLNASFTNASASVDLDNAPRLNGTVIDMGAYEVQNFPPTASAQNFPCGGIVGSLVANGTNIKWYNAATGGTALTTDTVLAAGTYYASQTVNGYESTRTAVIITIAGPPSANAQNHCFLETVANLTATGTGLKWYSVATDGTALPPDMQLVTGTYYVSQTVDGCEGSRKAVAVTVYTTPAPTAAASQSVSNISTTNNLVAVGQNLKWYNVATGGAPMSNTALLIEGTYYVSQTQNNCESPRMAIAVSISTVYGNIVYVRQGATGNGTTWDNAGSLQQMINTAVTGMQVWVAAGTYSPASGASFSMKEGVSVYGGFPATGTPGMSDRNYAANLTTLAGNNGRVINNANNGLTNAARLDGFTIKGGAAVDGAGISNVNAFPTIANCTITNNSATHWAGAILNQGSGSTKVINCLIKNNTADGGGGMFENLNATPKYINCTIANNFSGQNGGGIHTYQSAKATFLNCILWGNVATQGSQFYSNANGSVVLDFCIVSNTATTIFGPVTQTNTINSDPLFVNSAEGNFNITAASPAKNSGNLSFYPDAANALDIAGNPRLFDDGIDIGAFESQYTSNCSIATTWDGSVWSNGTPVDNSYAATIAGNYSSTGDLSACSLTVSSGTVTVNPGHNFNIKGAVTVTGGSLTFENNANLIQKGTANTNTGNITYKRSTSFRRLDYTFWSSPVASQNLLDFSPQTTATRFYAYAEATNTFPYVDPAVNSFQPAKGYMIRAPNNFQDYPAAAQLWTGKFTGVPNNGNYNMAVTHLTDGFNLVGNPYPSPIDADQFLAANPGTLYFWAHISLSPTVSSYASYNSSGGTAAAAGGEVPNGMIQAGQGFLIKAATSGNVSFNNTMRNGNTAGQFYRTAAAQKDRLWLNLATGQEPSNQMLVCYTTAATLGVDETYDGELMETGNSISSLIETTAYVIQARPSFTDTDEVPLSLETTAGGTYTISLDHFDGNFENQDVFLVDNQMNTIQNLKTAAYTFASEAGVFNTRFKIVYQNNVLGTDNPAAIQNQVVVYSKNHNIYINAGKMEISSVAVFDISGRLVYSNEDVNETTSIIQNLQVEQQVLLVRITGSHGEITSRKIVF